MSAKIKYIASAILLLALGGAAASCASSAQASDGKEPTEKEAAVQPAPQKKINVKVETVTPETLVEYVKATGVTKAQSDVTYSAEIAGKLEHLSVDLGERVKKGQVLARIDFSSLSAQAEQAEATRDLAKKTFDRLSSLAEEKLVSDQQVDEARSRLVQAEAQLKIIRSSLSKSTIRSEISGVITEKNVSKGEYVSPGMRLFRIIDHSHIIVEASLAETQVAKVQKGQHVDVLVDALGKEVRGVVESVIPAADPVSKTFTVRIDVDNPERDILVGMATTVSVTSVEHTGVVVTKQDVVVEEGETKAVFVTDGDVVRKRVVTLGATEGDRVVLTSGVNPGDKIVVVGQRDLVDEQPVNVVM